MSGRRRAPTTPPWSASASAAAAMTAFACAVVVTTEFVVIGLLPALMRDLAITAAEAGRLVSGFALASAILGPPLTMAADRLAPHRVLAATLAVFAAGSLATALAPDYAVALTARLAQGAALPVLVSVGSVAVADLAGPGGEGRAVAAVYMGVATAMVIAIPGGVLVADVAGWPACFLALAALAAVGAGVLGTRFPRPGEPSRAASKAQRVAQALILGQSAVLAHLLLSALLFTAMFTAYSYLAAFLETTAGFDGTAIAAALMGFGASGLLGNWIAGRVAGSGPTAATAGVALALALAMAAASLTGGATALLLPLLVLWGAAHTAAFVLCQLRVMRAAPTAPAFAAALNISACNLGIAAGAVIGGWVTARHGIAAIGFAGAALAAGTLITAVAILWLDRCRTPRAEPAPPG